MSKLLRVYRVNGDCLSIRFAPDGHLSTAILLVEGQQRNCAAQLPGLREENSLDYLGQFGYLPEYDEACREIGRELNHALARHQICVECVRRTDRGFCLSVIDNKRRTQVCPVLLFAGIHDMQNDKFQPLRVNHQPSFTAFLQTIHGS